MRRDAFLYYFERVLLITYITIVVVCIGALI